MSSDATGQSVGARIRELRRDAGLSIEELAHKAAGLSATYLGTVERGAKSPTIGVLVRIADALGVGVGALLEPYPAATTAQLRQIVKRRIDRMDDAELRRLVRLLDALS